MKHKWIAAGACLILAAALGGCRAQMADTPQQAVRLHIVAHSDTPHDQQQKLRVRDALLAAFADNFADVTCADDAWDTLQAEKTLLEETAQNVLRQEGSTYGVRVTFGVENFPARNYMGRVWPAGQYRTVRVLLGQSAGHNWWCVMYPPLCLADTSAVDMEEYYARIAALSEEEEIPTVPVRSWLFDRLLAPDNWDAWFAKAAKRFLK